VTRIANAGSDLLGAVSPGEIVTISGSFLGPDTALGLQLTSTGSLITQLGDTIVSFDGIQAPLIQVSSQQITAIAPYEIDGRASVNLVVKNKEKSSPPINLAVVAAAPGIFLSKAIGTAFLTIFNSDLSVNGPNHGAAKGSSIILFATGEGLLNPLPQTGSIATPNGGGFAKPVNAVSATIDGQTAQVQYAAQGPGLISGIMQVELTIPAGSSSGQVALVLTIGTASTVLQMVTVTVL